MGRLLGICFLAGGAVMLLAAASALIKRRKLEKRGATCQARVVRVAQRRIRKANYGSRTVYDPVVAYTLEGNRYEAAVIVGASQSLWKEGDEMEILYLPDRPDAPATTDGSAVKGGITASFISTAVFFAAGLVLILRNS